MANEVSRRDLIGGSAAALAAMAAAKVEAAVEPEALSPIVPVDKLRFGIIGCGGKGSSGMKAASAHGEIVAICDTDANERSKGMLEHPRATTFVDYREMIGMMRGKVNAVVISTPDHHHAIASALAMKAGMHVYCEKPLTRTIWEARQLAGLARRHRVATQMGNQSTASTPMRKVAALIKNGLIGDVREIHLWTNRASGWWKQGVPRPAPAKQPSHLAYDLWLGPSPERPYADGYHPFAWRGWWDFGTGSLGDMGCHIFNMAFMALDLRDPIAVRAETSGHNRDSFPEWAIVHYEFGRRGGRAPLEVHWYDGGKKPEAKLAPGVEFGGNGVLAIGSKGTIYGADESNMNFQLLGGTIPDIQVVESPGHMTEFARAALGGDPAVSNFPGYSGALTETVLLGNLAIWANGPRLEWDAKGMRVRGQDDFQELIRPKYRPGWIL